MLKAGVLAVLPLLLSACGIPAVVAVTAAADGVAYMGTGKSLSSHALSAAADRDCSILFGMTRGRFCKEKEKPDDYAKRGAGFVIPKDEPAARDHVTQPPSDAGSAASRAALEPRFFDFDYETPPPTVRGAPPDTHTTPAAAVRSGGDHMRWALVLGSFKDHRDAIDLARRIRPGPALVTAVMVRGEINYLVSTKPVTRDDVGRQSNIAALKLNTVKLMPVCPAGVRHEKCLSLDQTLEIQQATLP